MWSLIFDSTIGTVFFSMQLNWLFYFFSLFTILILYPYFWIRIHRAGVEARERFIMVMNRIFWWLSILPLMTFLMVLYRAPIILLMPLLVPKIMLLSMVVTWLQLFFIWVSWWLMSLFCVLGIVAFINHRFFPEEKIMLWRRYGYRLLTGLWVISIINACLFLAQIDF